MAVKDVECVKAILDRSSAHHARAGRQPLSDAHTAARRTCPVFSACGKRAGSGGGERRDLPRRDGRPAAALTRVPGAPLFVCKT
ncbi:MAG: hypothetical protein JWP47_2527 [Polaromonas sp.]|jgi:hypothetical protein|nr:hypothetical protein [Polaromonas sp.]